MTEVTEHADMHICFQLLTVTIGVSFLGSHAVSLERSLWPLYSKCPTPYDAIAAVLLLSHVRLFVTPWTVAPPRLLCPWDFPAKSTGVSCHFLLQGIFPTQGLNLCLLLGRWFFTTESPRKPILYLLPPGNFISLFQVFFNGMHECLVVVQSLSHVRLFAAPWTAACQAFQSFTISRSLL